MLDNKAEHEPDGEETEEHNLEDFWKKYPWWLIGHESRGQLHLLRRPKREIQ